MIFIKVNSNDDPTKARIMSRFYVPFDPVNGFKKADGTLYTQAESAQLETDQHGYLVEYDESSEPQPNPPAGQICTGTFFNIQTKQYMFEYGDKPLAPLDNSDMKSMLISLLKDSIN